MVEPACIPIKSVTLEYLENELRALGQPPYRAAQVMQWIYRNRVRGFEDMTNLPATLRKNLGSRFIFEELEPVRRTGSSDTTQKVLFRLPDKNLIETVLIPASPALYGERSDRKTICISSQVGCAYGCRFCASGLEGWKRNLQPGEIVEQLLEIEKLSGEKVNNIVFMGMGEPLANYDNLLQAIAILNAPWGVGLGARHITVSTSGLVPKIRALAEQPLQIRLAISLHGATDEVRSRIMPVNRKHNVAELLDACEYYTCRKQQRITFEYILIDRVNDGLDQAAALASHALRLGAKVNLIPYNTVEGLDWSRPSARRQEAFREVLGKAGVPATLRREKGHDIAAACGQLRLRTERDKSFAESGEAFIMKTDV